MHLTWMRLALFLFALSGFTAWVALRNYSVDPVLAGCALFAFGLGIVGALAGVGYHVGKLIKG